VVCIEALEPQTERLSSNAKVRCGGRDIFVTRGVIENDPFEPKQCVCRAMSNLSLNAQVVPVVLLPLLDFLPGFIVPRMVFRWFMCLRCYVVPPSFEYLFYLETGTYVSQPSHFIDNTGVPTVVPAQTCIYDSK
jgi:hypothetical protein